jgi:hypothetical protein
MEFQAQWVWLPGEPAPRNAVAQFRREFAWEAVPTPVRLSISADSRYLLWVNGHRVGYGPARAYQFNYEYDVYDIEPWLASGPNVIAVLVLHWGEATFHHLVGRGGLLAQVDAWQDGPPLVVTDATWRCRLNPAYRRDVPRIACQLPWEEQVDARLDDPAWLLAGYDDSSWERAALVGPAESAPWMRLSPRAIPFLTDEPVAPVRAFVLGEARRPEVVASLHLAPYVSPGDALANYRAMDALAATVLRAPRGGHVTFKSCLLYGQPPVAYLDGKKLSWRPDASSDVSCVRRLGAGDHALLLDWQAASHDTDVTLTASGVKGLAVAPFLPDQPGAWAIAVAPGRARGPARRAANVLSLRTCGADWRPVADIDAPSADVYMDITASRLKGAPEAPARFPIAIPATKAGAAQHAVVDFGREVAGWIELDVEAMDGAVVDLLGFEGVQDGQRQITQLMNNTLRYGCRPGRQRYTSIHRRGFRYLLVAAHGAPVTLHNVTTRLATYPGAPRGQFRCSDPRLNQVWEMCAYTLRLCSEDTFTDCPAYEQTFWVGDARNESLIHHAVHGDPRLVERCWRLAADSLERSPIVNSQVPSGWETYPIPNWAWLWAMGCQEHYQHTGDRQFARDLYPALARQAAFVESSIGPDGLFAMRGAWHLLEWSDIDDRDPNSVVAHENCLAAAALRATAEMAELVRQPEDAARWRGLADRIAGAVNQVFWSDARQAYVDSLHEDGKLSKVVSQGTNVAALLSGVAQGERARALAPNVVACPDGWVGAGSPFALFFSCEVLARQGRHAELLAVIRDRWGDMLDKGATTAWETFANYLPGAKWTRSWCHAWSAAPAYFLSAHVLGIRPLRAGYDRALIAPRLCDLDWVEGRMPTPRGEIEARVARGERGLSARIGLPAGVPAEVRLPAGVSGEPPVVAGAEAAIARDGDGYVVDLPAGARVEIACR